MDAYLAIVSVRVVREYSERPISDDALHRILQAGRVTGSSRNTQPWKFYVVRSRELLGQLAGTVFAPDNVRRCQVAIGISTTAKSPWDAGRCAQNMILAAWAEGVGSCPNGLKDMETCRRLLRLSDDESLVSLLSLGYPRTPYQPPADDIGGIISRINRRPLNDVVTWVT